MKWHFLAFWCCLAPLAQGAEFPQPFNTEADAHAQPTSPQQALKNLRLPDGFQKSLFAAEPDVQNPIAMAWDARGRLWIAENYTYADGKTKFDFGLRDRVLIFDDTDGDGQFDTRKVFTDEVQMLTSIEVGHGGVWMMCPPKLVFIPDADHNDIPDGPAEVKLDGFTVYPVSYHNFANGLRWGPDGWLYGRCGGSCPGEIGVPDTPAEKRQPLRGGMWRFHPSTGHVDILMTGTTNPWGHDWNALSECFFVNTVNGHFWHLIPGGHCERNATLDPNPHVFELMDQHADHWHFDTGKGWQESRDGAANDLGGGHAHSGATIYLGDNWPEEYRGDLYTVNLHGRRLNREIPERSGAGYIAHHGKDFLFSDDPWFRAIDLSYGPDGGVMLIDWSDTGECHERDGVHRTSGRIYKLFYGNPRPVEQFDLHERSHQELVQLHRHRNAWYLRQARLVLTERYLGGADMQDAVTPLNKMLKESDPVVRLNALLTLSCIGKTDEELLRTLLKDPHEALRTWSVRLLTAHWPLDGPLGPVPYAADHTRKVKVQAEHLLPELISLAETDSSGLVRLALGSTLQRLPLEMRPQLARALVARPEDREDPNLPLLVWYGLIPVADAHPAALVGVADACRWPMTRRLIARRLAEKMQTYPGPIDDLIALSASKPTEYQSDILNGISEALSGWRSAPRPSHWETAAEVFDSAGNASVKNQVRELSVVFGDGRALDEVRRMALDRDASPDVRRSALETLIEARPDDLGQICLKLIDERYVNTIAAKGLSLFDDPEIGAKLANAYRRFRAPERPEIMAVLVSRPAFAGPMLDAMQRGLIPEEDLTVYHVRQIHSFQNEQLTKRVTDVWGELRDSSAEKQKLIETLRSQLEDAGQLPQLARGRVLFNDTCSKCHRLYGHGGTVGPDLTGSNRNNLNYLLENIVDPSAQVNKDFRMTVLALADGRILNGLVTEENEHTLTLQTLTDRLVIEKSEIDQRKLTNLSPMPEGMLEKMTPEQVRDLIGYLRHPSQVPLPEGADKTASRQ